METRKTPLYDAHLKLGARMVDFAGWSVPLQYTGIVQEHLAVRQDCGLFDVSHMGQVLFEGDGAFDTLQKLTTNDISKLEEGQAIYTVSCYPDGGIVDDFVVYNLGREGYMACVNAATRQKDLEWFHQNVGEATRITDKSDEYAQLALQGRHGSTILSALCDEDISGLKPFRHLQCKVAGCPTLVSGTGYTGEDGYELYLPSDFAEKVWWALLDEGKPYNLVPCGFGCRDTLRLEMRFCLYGTDIDNSTSPLEAGLGWLVKLDKGEFIGRNALMQLKEQGLSRRLVGFEIEGRAIARHGSKILVNGNVVGTVTSGGHSPSLGKPIALGYVDKNFSKIGTELEVGIRNRKAAARIVKTPFYSRPY